MATASHHPAPGHAPAHEPKPPDHVKPVDPSKRGELVRLSTELKKRGERIYADIASPLDVGGSDHRSLVDRASEYRLRLDSYWKFVRDCAADTFVFRNEGSKPELDKLNKSLEQIDKDLTPQLERWKELSDPFGDTYDIDAMKAVAKSLSDSIRAAGMQLKAQMEVSNTPEGKRRNVFRAKLDSL